jgi:hypothetical protein
MQRMSVESVTPKAHDPNVLIGEAVRRHLGSLSQNQLAARLHIDSGQFSKMLNGRNAWTLRRIVLTEQELGLEPGVLLRAGGYVKESKTVREHISTDPALNAATREIVLSLYDQLTALDAKDR